MTLHPSSGGFKAGIDDYMVKPIDLDELLLRIEALLRRAKIATSKKLIVGNLTLDAEEHTAYLNDEEVPLTVREFTLFISCYPTPKRLLRAPSLWTNFGIVLLPPVPVQWMCI